MKDEMTLEKIALARGYEVIGSELVDWYFKAKAPERRADTTFTAWKSMLTPSMFYDSVLLPLLAHRGIGFSDILDAVEPALRAAFNGMSIADEQVSCEA